MEIQKEIGSFEERKSFYNFDKSVKAKIFFKYSAFDVIYNNYNIVVQL